MQLWVDQILFNDYEALMIRYVNLNNGGNLHSQNKRNQ